MQCEHCNEITIVIEWHSDWPEDGFTLHVAGCDHPKCQQIKEADIYPYEEKDREKFLENFLKQF